MRAFTRAWAGLAIAVALSGSVAAGASAAPATAGRPVAAGHPAAAAHGFTFIYTCGGRAFLAPRAYVIACADANDVLVFMHWQAWGFATAFGHGWEAINNCAPTCARGHFIRYPVTVVLWGRNRGLRPRYFTRMTIIYTGRRPRRFPVTRTLRLGRHGPS